MSQTKTKVITLTNHKGERQSSEPIKTRSQSKARENVPERVQERVTIGFGFNADWLRKWREFFEPITIKRRNQCKTKENFRHSSENCSTQKRFVENTTVWFAVYNNKIIFLLKRKTVLPE